MQQKNGKCDKGSQQTVDLEQYQDLSSWHSEQWFYNLTEYIPGVSIQGYTTDGTVIFWNEASEKIYGYYRAEAIGKNLADLIIPSELRPLFEKALDISKTVTRSGELMPAGELMLLHKDGSLVPVYSIHTIVCHPEKQPVLFCIDMDLSERKKNESELKQLNRTLADKNKHLESIIQIATHDLRTPMINVEGFAGEMNKGLDKLRSLLSDVDIPNEKRAMIQTFFDDEFPESLGFINQGIGKMNLLLEALLHLAHLGISEIHFEQLDMNKLIREIHQSMLYQARASGADITIEDLPDCWGDRFHLSCVFSNLLSNALKYLDSSRKGEISISGKQDGDHVIYCVSDNGIGIHSENLEKIFNVFYRVDGTDQEGQGLGLTVVKRILSRHNGDIMIESEFGKGSRFFVKIPIVPL